MSVNRSRVVIGLFVVVSLALQACGSNDPARDEVVAVASGALTAANCPAGYNIIQGTNGANTLIGTAGNDCILGLGGADTIWGRGGNDFIAGGSGDDIINGEGGNDVLYGEAGVDTIHGGDNDDTIHGDDGNDNLYGDNGDDIIDGDANADQIWGGAGDDIIYGDAANDTMQGEDGDDALIGGAGTNTANGGPGIDACSGSNCEKPQLTLSGCTQNSQCGSGKHCIADFGLCIGCVSDQDNDLVCDSKDGCPNDAQKAAPGVCGCGVADTDSDGDGTPNCNDQCPNNAQKIAPGVCGCALADTDSDGDGTPNCNDQCPSDAQKIAPGVCGCGSSDGDSDGDGTADCNDGCPSDAGKVAAGACGCGVSDTDSDGDGTPNCNDGCPSDAGKVTAGVCGCGVADADSDGDGVLNCNDGCPSDANKASAGVCGCGVPDIDGDGDGAMNCVDVCPGGDDRHDGDHDGVPDACDTATAIVGPIAEATFENLDGVAGFENTVQSGMVRTAGANWNNGIIEVRRAVFEFDLSGLSAAAHIVSAQLELTPAGASYSPPGWQLQIWGYTADGAISTADAQREDTLLATRNVANALPFSADVNAIGDLFVQGPMVGVLLRSNIENSNLGAVDIYGAAGWSPPRLHVTYYIDCAGSPDSDGDGVCDAADRCPGSDVADGDGDGVPDGCDACPSDAQKTAAGTCGCGVPDTDGDNDGTPDCVDACPSDNPNDSDGDGVCNSADRCPGFDDRLDSDGDGIPNDCDPCSSAADCNDGKSCTTDSCELSGCVHQPVQSGQACGAGGLCSADGACVHTVDLAVLSRATVVDSTNDGVFESVQSGVVDPWVRRIAFQGIFLTQRGLIEWNAAVLPANATLRTVELRASLTRTKGPGSIQIRGYAGDGVADLADAFAGPVVDATFSISSDLSPVVNLLTPARGWLAAGRTIWGMNLRGADEAASSSVDERATFGFSSPFLTRLVVSYTDE